MEELELTTQETEQVLPPEGDVTVVDIRFRSGGKTYYFDPGDLQVAAGDEVIIDTSRGPEFGLCTAGCHTIPARDVVTPLRSVIRIATEADKKTAAENREKEKRAYAVCLQKIEEHQLDMQLVSAECAFDGSKILFFFTADGRVDFRELVKNLASIFRTRIELRQIGVRDKAKMVGGLGVCGRPFCCSQFLADFQPVSIKMAKTQNLSLNPTKISGTCGRLMCCLKYEQEAYEDLLKTAPKAESFVDTPDGRGTVTDVNLLRQTVKVRMEDQPETIGCYHNCDICVLRSGKAKKNDPPIPKDLAPISSKKKPGSKFEREDSFPALEPIIYHSDAAQNPVATEEPAKDAPAEGSAPRRRKKKKPASQNKEAQAPKEQQREHAPKEHHGEKNKGSKEGAKPRPQQPKKQHSDKPHADKPHAEKHSSEKPAGNPSAPRTEDGEKKKSRHRYRRRKPKPQTPPSTT